MRNNRWVWVGVYLVATAVLAAGVIVLVRDQDTSDAAAPTDELAALAPMPFPSTITPVGGSSGRVGDTLLFQAEGFPEDEVASVELWDGEQRIETETAPGGTGAVLTLPALSVGPHSVYAKVIDAEGEESRTPPTPVTIVANGSDPVPPVEVAADEDETVEQLAKRLDVDIEAIGIIAGGQEAVVPTDIKPLVLSPSDVIPVDAVVSVQPDGDAGLAETVSGEAQVPTGKAKAPKGNLTLAAAAKGCAVTLTSSGGSGEIDYYDGTGSTVGWRRVGQSTGNGSVTVPAVAPGMHLYTAADSKGETSPLSVTMPPNCAKAVGWTGDVSITDGILSVNRDVPAGRRWLYLQVDGGTAVRVPSTGDLPSGLFHADIGALLPPLEGSSMTVELWQGEEFSEQLIAKGSLQAPEGSSISEIVGESRMLDLKLTEPAGAQAVLKNQDRKLTFTWTAGPRIEAVLYQVLVNDQLVTQTTLPPEELLLTGVSARKDAGSGGTGTFTINTADIPGRTATGREAASVAPVYPVAAPEVLGTKVTSSKKPKTVTLIGPDTAARESEAPVLIDLPTFGDDVWVRAIGLSSTGSRTASPTVRVQLPVPQGVNGTSVDFVSGHEFGDTTWKPGHRPVRTFTKCVWADVSWQKPVDFGDTSGYNEHGQGLRIIRMSNAYPKDGTYCPEDFPPPPPPADDDCGIGDVFCAIWDGIVTIGGTLLTVVEAVYNFVTTVISTVVDKIASAIVKYSGVCEALETVASGSEKTCGAVLTMVVKAAISAVLASVGVPPAIVLLEPGLLDSLAKGDFATVAVGLMEAVGIPCSSFKPDPDVGEVMDQATGLTGKGKAVVEAIKDPCLAMATAIVRTVKTQVLTKAQVAIAQGGGLPFEAIDSKNYKLNIYPSPLGQVGQTPVTLRMQPKDDNATISGPCTVTLRVANEEGLKKGWSVVPSQNIVIPEMGGPNRGRWEKELTLTSAAKGKLLSGTWHLIVTPTVQSPCRLETIDLPGEPAVLPNYAKGRRKTMPTAPEAVPPGGRSN